ncbi:probable E3 ubiquitin ligase SUD1 isoform X2 [Amborella trichopoda]|uniref:probable E3 ubiquitin ligase SUD1 isoform X2 n=1 Tax=Amborella trichopoda TaxID=13333 RepID=UPI0005D39615|nr:probable E3 ubiquitin ligase SUD1 isoform X2 [Amborella trichopoda]|eukprot:XP_011625609.1 probable E3 ubiquitin ligase SUD1 isoform X2 [Amborella trichopoda]
MEIASAQEEEARRERMPESFRAMEASNDSNRRHNEEEEDEEDDVCRICRNPGDAENPLRYPCACSGSIKFVHQECLLQWLDHSNARQCEVCKHAFSFSPVYAENAPMRLPFQEFLVGMAMKACHVLQFFLRLAFVLSVWLTIIPFITFWIWRLAFVRSIGEAQRLFLSHLSAAVILTDCLHGFLLSAGIVFIFLGATSLRDYFRHLRELGGVQDAEREDDGLERHGPRVRRPPGQGGARNPAAAGNGEDNVGGQGIAGAGQIIRRNAENVAARLEMQAARLEAHVEQMFDGLDDADGAEDVPFDELVGMQGPVFHLVENAITVLASNAIFIGVVFFLPFSLGRVILFYASWLLPSSTSSVMLSTVKPVAESGVALANITLQTVVTNFSSDGGNEGLIDQVVKVASEALKTNMTGLDEVSHLKNGLGHAELLKGAGALQLSDVGTLVTGYMLIFCLVFFYLGLVALIRYSRGEPLTIGRFYGIASIAEAIPSVFKQFLSGMKHLMTTVKVAFLLVIELGVFPLMCGWWLDICTIRMLGSTIAQRVEFFSISPSASSFIHWLVGILYMLQISIFVSLLRGVLRPGVLYFLRDPADPNYNPFRDLIDDPVHKHARRVMLSVAVYGTLIVMLVFLPVKLAMRLAPSVFPLDISVSDPFTEIPVDMLLFQIAMPFAIQHFRLRATIKAVLYRWFVVAGWALGLTDFLLARPGDNSGRENGNAEQGRQERLHDARRGGVEQQEWVVIEHPANGDANRAAGNMDAAAESDVDDQSDSEEYGFVIRIILLLFLAWMTLLLFNSALIVGPVSLGRATFSTIPRLPITHGVKCNDMYAFTIGCYIIWAMAAGVGYLADYLKTRSTRVLLSQTWKWCTILLKSSALLSIWVFIIPVLIGLLFELLVVVPMRVPVDESPVFLLYQDWALGLIFLKIWMRLVVPLIDESWRVKLERVRADGFYRLQGAWVLKEVVGPILIKLLTVLCVPYVLARGLFPALGYSLVVNSAVYRFAWVGCLCLALLCFCIRRFHVWFTNLHNSIRDDRYLIGRRLHNFGEDAPLNNPLKDGEVPSTSSSFSPNDTLLPPQAEVADFGLRARIRNHN